MDRIGETENVNDQAYQRTSVPAREEKFTIQHTSPYVKKHLGVKLKFVRSKAWVYSSQSHSLLGVKSERSFGPHFTGIEASIVMVRGSYKKLGHPLSWMP